MPVRAPPPWPGGAITSGPLPKLTNDEVIMSDDLQELSERMRGLTENALNTTASITEQRKRALTTGNKRYLEYFWNTKTQTIRSTVPFAVISFLEAETVHESLSELIASRVRADMLDLISKGYVEYPKIHAIQITGLPPLVLHT